MVGDLKNGRTVHSLVNLLSQYHVTLNYVAPPSLRLPEEVRADVRRHGITQNDYTKLDEVIAHTDVLYVTRIQRERFSDLKEYEEVKGTYVVNNSLMTKAKTHMIV